MARTTPLAVEGILLKDYDSRNRPSLLPFIRGANLIVSRVATCATNKGTPLSDEELVEIEGWVAAYLYTRPDPIYQSKNTDGAGAGFVQDPVDPERYRAGALALDPSGCLKAQLSGQRAGGAWLGKNPSTQTAYADRR